ncbi:MAG TPA: glycogen debranching protein GlgX [Chloroflexota bacterium]|nr:glycogen debranching protein GlgX [Chloroflexota bacterium]
MAERSLTIWPGRPDPLGTTWDGQGTNFAVYAQQATRVELCLFDDVYGKETARVALPEQTRHVWHAYVQGVGPGQLYGYRVHGRYAPREGLRFNPNKLLIDPYTRAIRGAIDWNAPIFAYRIGSRTEDLTRDVHNSARGMPKSMVVDDSFDWGNDRSPRVPFSETIIYETHVKGISMRHPDVAEDQRGTYLGLASEPIIDHLLSLGVTAVELLPIQQFVDDKFLLERGLTNYWGYNSIGYFAPTARYASDDRGQQVTEFKEMVKRLHAAGLEVFLDVVYNHTAEGNHLGPTLAFRGLDNSTYYNLMPDNRRYYRDFTGTGNSLNVCSSQTLKLIADSLRYWIQEMHVDGFRFDLAITLAREPEAYDPGAAFFDIVHQDPVISRAKLIAEPWDVGDFGYQVGNCPVLWSEWNGKYRDNVRKFWKGDAGQIAELAYRLSGSSDLYRLSGRGPTGSINFIAAHDGFTVRDLVSYNDKHNEANGEHNQDGANDNNSWNSGVEGPSEDPSINELRLRRQRTFLATLLLSQGVPMLLGGDEMGRTQQGNNNAYCQDNEISWFDWDLNAQQRGLLEFTRGLIAFRKQHPVLHRRRFFEGLFLPGADIKDLTWFRLDGTEMQDAQWADPEVRSMAMRVAGEAIDERQEEGSRISDATLLVLLNSYHEELTFTLPEAGGPEGSGWELFMDTRASAAPGASGKTYAVDSTYVLAPRALALFRRAEP